MKSLILAQDERWRRA